MKKFAVILSFTIALGGISGLALAAPQSYDNVYGYDDGKGTTTKNSYNSYDLDKTNTSTKYDNDTKTITKYDNDNKTVDSYNKDTKTISKYDNDTKTITKSDNDVKDSYNSKTSTKYDNDTKTITKSNNEVKDSYNSKTSTKYDNDTKTITKYDNDTKTLTKDSYNKTAKNSFNSYDVSTDYKEAKGSYNTKDSYNSKEETQYVNGLIGATGDGTNKIDVFANDHSTAWSGDVDLGGLKGCGAPGFGGGVNVSTGITTDSIIGNNSAMFTNVGVGINGGAGLPNGIPSGASINNNQSNNYNLIGGN